MRQAKRYTLTPEVQQTICAFIKAGGYPHVAAEAAGVPRQVFERWLEYGSPRKGKKVRKIYADFKAAVDQAIAVARLNAEIKAFQDDPVAWLKSGPGKEKPNDPGWSLGVKASCHRTTNNINVLLSPEMQSLFALLLQSLTPYPEARAAVALALAGNMRVLDYQPTQTERSSEF